VAVAAWTGAAAGVLGAGGARLYLGLETTSGTAAAVLLGVLWTAVFIVAWSTRDRAVGERQQPAGSSPTPPQGPRRPAEPC
jgi:undecaprenyl-diphosphatase